MSSLKVASHRRWNSARSMMHRGQQGVQVGSNINRGRVESRLIKVSQELCPSLQAEWPGITHVAQLTRTRTEKGETSVEVVYLITILPPGQDGPHDLLALVRGHWTIENSMHYVRDVTFAEDRSRIRTGHAPQLLAACRNLALTLIHRSGSSHIAASRRSFSYHPRWAFDLLFARASPPSNNSQALLPWMRILDICIMLCYYYSE